MVELRILGTASVDGLPSSGSGGLLTQPKGLALLVYLLLARDGGALTRDDVVAVLWPESPPDRARGALRNLLHGLRARLGGDVIRSTGDRLSIDRTMLSCDAVRFETLLAEGRPTEAVDLYRGDLLRGFHLKAAPPFTRWLDQRRGELRTTAARAAWRLSELAGEGGNWVTAADHARQAVRWSSGSEQSVRRLMALLDRAGDRVAALQAYETFAGRWKSENGLEPSAETRELAEAIRSGARPRPSETMAAFARTGRAGTRWRPTEPPPRVAVLPFLRVGADRATDVLGQRAYHVGSEAYCITKGGYISTLLFTSDLKTIL